MISGSDAWARRVVCQTVEAFMIVRPEPADRMQGVKRDSDQLIRTAKELIASAWRQIEHVRDLQDGRRA